MALCSGELSAGCLCMHTSEETTAGKYLAAPPCIHQAADGPRVGRKTKVNLQGIMKVRACLMAPAA
jgi:hypothetical protein